MAIAKFLQAESFYFPATADPPAPYMRFVIWLDDEKTVAVPDAEPGMSWTGKHLDPDPHWLIELVVTTAEATTPAAAVARAKQIAIREWHARQPCRALPLPVPFDAETGDDLRDPDLQKNG